MTSGRHFSPFPVIPGTRKASIGGGLRRDLLEFPTHPQHYTAPPQEVLCVCVCDTQGIGKSSGPPPPPGKESRHSP